MSDERCKEDSGRACALARTASVFFILVARSFVSLLVDNFHLGLLSLRCGLFAQSLEDIDMGVSLVAQNRSRRQSRRTRGSSEGGHSYTGRICT